MQQQFGHFSAVKDHARYFLVDCFPQSHPNTAAPIVLLVPPQIVCWNTYPSKQLSRMLSCGSKKIKTLWKQNLILKIELRCASVSFILVSGTIKPGRIRKVVIRRYQWLGWGGEACIWVTVRNFSVWWPKVREGARFDSIWYMFGIPFMTAFSFLWRSWTLCHGSVSWIM